eukprot:206661_1
MGNLCCGMLAPHAIKDELLGKSGDVPATSNLMVMVGTDEVLHNDEDLGMQKLDEKRGVAAKENNVTEGQRNDTAVDTTDISKSSDDAVITGFGLTGVTVPSAVSDQQGSTSKKMEEVSQSEKDPSLSDDKDQLGQVSKLPSESPKVEKEHSDFTEFENKISTKGIGPVTKYSRSGKPSSRLIMIDKASETFYWAEVGTSIHQRRKSSGFFRNIQDPFKLCEMKECTLINDLKDKSGLPMQSSIYESSFLVVFPHRSVYFTAESPELASQIVAGFNFLKERYNSDE